LKIAVDDVTECRYDDLFSLV